MENLIFDDLEEAKNYSKKYFDGFNLIYGLNGKCVYGSSSRKSLMNPKLYIREVITKLSTKLDNRKENVIKSFLDL